MNTFSRSYFLVKQSFAVLRQDKELLLFPLISGFFEILLIASFLVPVFLFTDFLKLFEGLDENTLTVWTYALLFVFYLLSFFIVTFFNVGLITCASIRLKGGNPTFKDGINNSLKNIWKIFLWSLVASTFGMILRIIEDKTSFVGRLIARFIGIVWSLVTFLVVPIVIYENVNVFQSIKRSAELFKKTWGEQVVGNFSMNLFFAILIILGFIPVFAVVMGSAIFYSDTVFPVFLLIGLFILTILYLFSILLVSSSLQGIYTAALYMYATTNTVPPAFSPDVIQHAFRPKKQKNIPIPTS